MPSSAAATFNLPRTESIVRLTDLVCRVGRRLISHPCQVRGLTLYYFLRRAGLDVSLVFGMGRVGDQREGHCWLVRNEEPYLERVDPREHFTAIYAFGSYKRDLENRGTPRS